MTSKGQGITWLGGLVSLSLLLGLSGWLVGCFPQPVPPTNGQPHQGGVPIAQSAPTNEATLPASNEEKPSPQDIWEKVTLDDIEFGSPQVVLTDTRSIPLLQWISNEEFLFIQGLRAKGTVKIYNTRTRDVTPLVTADIMGRPLWSPAEQTVLYRAYDYRTERIDLWRASLDTDEAELLSKEVDHPFLLGRERGGGIGWSPKVGNLVFAKGEKVIAEPLDLDFSPYMLPKLTGRDISYRITPSPVGRWQAVYDNRYFLLVDVDEGVIEEISLPGQVLGVGGNPAPTWALLAVWSPDGQQIAIIATTGELPVGYVWLYIYDIQTKETIQLDVPREVYVSNLAWDPKGRFLLVQHKVGLTERGSALQGTVLLDINTGQKQIKSLFPPESIGGMAGEQLMWSPDGNFIAFHCRKSNAPYSGVCISKVKVQ